MTVYYVDIYLSLDGGNNWDLLVDNFPADQNYPFSFPNTESDVCLIKILNSNNQLEFDISDKSFSINSTFNLQVTNTGASSFCSRLG